MGNLNQENGPICLAVSAQPSISLPKIMRTCVYSALFKSIIQMCIATVLQYTGRSTCQCFTGSLNLFHILRRFFCYYSCPPPPLLEGPPPLLEGAWGSCPSGQELDKVGPWSHAQFGPSSSLMIWFFMILFSIFFFHFHIFMLRSLCRQSDWRPLLGQASNHSAC